VDASPAATDATLLVLVADAGIGFLLALGLVVLLALFGALGLVLKAVFSAVCFVGSAVGNLVRRAPEGTRHKRSGNPTSCCYPRDEADAKICHSSKCGHENRPEAIYCGRCGAKL
jgi:hypothetical protein